MNEVAATLAEQLSSRLATVGVLGLGYIGLPIAAAMVEAGFTVLGSDVDVFTLGFHKNMAVFSQGPSVSDAQAEQAALKAGFKSRADLGYYLRSLLASQQDTLAVPVN